VQEAQEQAEEQPEVEEASPRRELELVRQLEKECSSWRLEVQDMLEWCWNVVEASGKHQSCLEEKVKG
jgi:hypothetical protein